MRARIAALSLVLSLAVIVPAVADELPGGNYTCTLGGYSMILGDIRIEGSTYAGPAFDDNYEGTYDYEVTDAGTINWNGPLGGLSSGGNTVTSTVLRDAGNGQVGFDIMVQVPDGDFQTVSCAPA